MILELFYRFYFICAQNCLLKNTKTFYFKALFEPLLKNGVRARISKNEMNQI